MASHRNLTSIAGVMVKAEATVPAFIGLVNRT